MCGQILPNLPLILTLYDLCIVNKHGKSGFAANNFRTRSSSTLKRIWGPMYNPDCITFHLQMSCRLLSVLVNSVTSSFVFTLPHLSVRSRKPPMPQEFQSQVPPPMYLNFEFKEPPLAKAASDIQVWIFSRITQQP